MSPHLFACLLSALGQITVDELIAEHEATMARIKALSVECDSFHIQAGKPPQHAYHQVAARDGTRARIQFRHEITRTPDGRKFGLICTDICEDGSTLRMLINWDQRAGRRAADSDGVRAEISPTSTGGHPWVYDPTALLLQRVSPGDGKSWNVADYLRKGTAVKLLPAVKENGRTLIPVSLHHPSFGNALPGVGIKSTLYFGPDYGGLILKQVHDVPAGKAGNVALTMETSVLSLQPVGEGLYLPTTLRSLTTNSAPGQSVHLEVLQQISDIRINEAVTDDAFAFHFPAGIVVKDRTQPGGIVMHRWGPHDAPAGSWVDEPPLWAYVLFAAEDGLSSRVLSAVGLFTALLSITAWYVIRRQRRKQQTAVTS